MSNSSISPIDRTLSGATTPARVYMGAKAKKGCYKFPYTGALPSDIL